MLKKIWYFTLHEKRKVKYHIFYLRVDNEPCADACICIRRLSANVRNSQSVFLIIPLFSFEYQ